MFDQSWRLNYLTVCRIYNTFTCVQKQKTKYILLVSGQRCKTGHIQKWLLMLTMACITVTPRIIWSPHRSCPLTFSELLKRSKDDATNLFSDEPPCATSASCSLTVESPSYSHSLSLLERVTTLCQVFVVDTVTQSDTTTSHHVKWAQHLGTVPSFYYFCLCTLQKLWN